MPEERESEPVCDEREEVIPTPEGEEGRNLANRRHAPSCSLYDASLD